MSKKEMKKLYQSLLNGFLSNETYSARTIPMQTPNKPCNGGSDYLLEAESAGKLSMEEKNVQEIRKIWQFMYNLYQEQLDSRKEIERLKKSTHDARKSIKDSDRLLQHVTVTLEKISGCVCKLQKQSNKENGKIEKLASDVKSAKRIIANISFLSGVCSMSDSLDKIAHNWNKATKRTCKQRKGLKHYMIDAAGEEMG